MQLLRGDPRAPRQHPNQPLQALRLAARALLCARWRSLPGVVRRRKNLEGFSGMRPGGWQHGEERRQRVPRLPGRAMRACEP